jgi:glycerol-3-phosphate acyltransferase PlsY
MLLYLSAGAAAYLLGSIPFGFLLTRMFLGTDVRAIGSGNIGATNVMRTGSKGLGIATLLLDAAKGYGAVALAHWAACRWHASADGSGANRPLLLMSIAAVCAILGHIFPVWLGFRGGKGVATGVGTFLRVAPKAVLIVLVIFVAVLAVFRYVSLASVAATAAFPVAAAFVMRRDDLVALPFMAGTAILIIAKHHSNLRRLLRHTEPRIGAPRPPDGS